MPKFDPTAKSSGILRFRLDLAYDGEPFFGWAKQPNKLTVQGVLEQALSLIFGKEVSLTVAGRTDAGVHAQGQVAHFDITQHVWDRFVATTCKNPELVLVQRLPGLLANIIFGFTRTRNYFVGGSIRVYRAQIVSQNFDARFSAVWRKYSYRIANDPNLVTPFNSRFVLFYKQKLNLAVMNEASSMLLGEHDFVAFCKPRLDYGTVRNLQKFFWYKDDLGLFVAQIQANAFCHNMVRALVSACLLVGRGLYPPVWLWERLCAKLRDPVGGLVAPHGLVLEQVQYCSDLVAEPDVTVDEVNNLCVGCELEG